METQPTKTFRLKPEAFRQRVRPAIWRVVLVYIAAIVIVLGTSAWPLTLGPVAFVVSITLVLLGFTIHFALRRQRAAWTSWELLATGYDLTRRIDGKPPITLAPNSITKITQNKRGDILIIGKGKYDRIFVPSDVADRPALLEMLSRFGQVDTAR